MKDYERFKGELRKELGIPLILPSRLSSRSELLVDAELHKNLPVIEEPEEGELSDQGTSDCRAALHVISLELDRSR